MALVAMQPSFHHIRRVSAASRSAIRRDLPELGACRQLFQIRQKQTGKVHTGVPTAVTGS